MSVRPIRVLIVDDVQESRDNVEKLLRFEPDIQVVGKASRGGEGVDQAVRLQPDIVLMDVNMPDMDGITATMEISVKAPSVSVIMMSVQDEPDVLRRAMLAGAREFLSKPFSLDELISAVRHVSRLAQTTPRPAATPNGATQPLRGAAPAHSRVFGVFSSKGGIGRSFMATNLAVAIRALTAKRVVLVDACHHFGDVGVMMNIPDGKTMTDIARQATSLDPDLIDDVLVTHASGVRVLLAPMSPQEAEIVTPDHLRATLELLHGLADYIIVDARPGFDDAMLMLMDTADAMLLMLSMEMPAIKDTRQFLEITELLGYPEEKIQLILNRTNSYSGIPVDDIAENLKREIGFRIPDDPAAVVRSINEGSPMVESNPDHKISTEILRLATSLVAKDIEQPAEAATAGRRRGGLVSRLRTVWRPVGGRPVGA